MDKFRVYFFSNAIEMHRKYEYSNNYVKQITILLSFSNIGKPLIWTFTLTSYDNIDDTNKLFHNSKIDINTLPAVPTDHVISIIQYLELSSFR